MAAVPAARQGPEASGGGGDPRTRGSAPRAGRQPGNGLAGDVKPHRSVTGGRSEQKDAGPECTAVPTAGAGGCDSGRRGVCSQDDWGRCVGTGPTAQEAAGGESPSPPPWAQQPSLPGGGGSPARGSVTPTLRHVAVPSSSPPTAPSFRDLLDSGPPREVLWAHVRLDRVTSLCSGG